MRTVLHYCIEEWPEGATYPMRISDGTVTVEGHDPSDWRPLLTTEVVKKGPMEGADPKRLIVRSLTVLTQTP